MIDTITQYIVDRLGKIKHQDAPVPVYSPLVPDREKGKTKDPHLAIELIAWTVDNLLCRNHEEFIPSEEQRTITVPEALAGQLHAVVTGTTQEPFLIEEAVNDALLLRVGADGLWGPNMPVTIVYGNRDAWEVARAVETACDDVVAESIDGMLRMQTRQPGADLDILAVENAAYETLGLAVGVVSHCEQTGPVSYTVKRQSVPLKLRYYVYAATTNETQQRSLEAMVLGVLPDGHWPKIGDQAPHFTMISPRLDDDASAPEYETGLLYEVSQVWVESLPGYMVPAIAEFSIEWA